MSYQEWSLTELKDELRQRKAKLSRRKKDLIARLQFLDAYKSSHNPEEPEMEFNMELPDSSCYKDIHAGMLSLLPNITMARLEEYLSQFDKTMDEKVKYFYTSRFLRYVRMAKQSDQTFLTSRVKAEMKKAACYKVDVCLNNDGVVLEAQCECGAGQGPNAHCKHVAAVIYGLISMHQSGQIITELTCTQVLQTFHKAKTFKGSPVKIEQLETIRGKENNLVYDPRPAHMCNKPETQARFQSICINFAHSAEKPIGCLQLYPPANIPAICHDHDYMELTPEDQYLKNNMVSKITHEEAVHLETRTRGQSGNKFWMSTRLHHLTSSNFGVICKGTERRDMHKLAVSLTEVKDIRTAAVLHGRKFESIAVEAFEKKMDIKSKVCGIFVCTDYPELAASPDRVIDIDACLENKCPYSARDKKVTPQTVPYLRLINDELTLDVNHDYYYQVQGQLLCTNKKLCYFVIYTFEDMVILKIYRDEIFIKSMVEKLLSFYGPISKLQLPAPIAQLVERPLQGWEIQVQTWVESDQRL